ncbi:unnamed protein product [Fraxinus pennsylvanica]|uniref:Uncharacterized protein n=1 Tax=Fraxinus pennsylvanica TaxID=56036 RepID=A0AAD1ZVN6_9LAMI|nr:unnamed protein product [Fraxinus pennsylvanica]
MPKFSSSSRVGFQWSTNGDKAFTTWLMSGICCASRAVQYLASSATFQILEKVSSSVCRIGSREVLTLSLFWICLRNQVTRWVWSSGNESSNTLRPVMVSIKTTQRQRHQLLLSLFPVAVWN